MSKYDKLIKAGRYVINQHEGELVHTYTILRCKGNSFEKVSKITITYTLEDPTLFIVGGVNNSDKYSVDVKPELFKKTTAVKAVTRVVLNGIVSCLNEKKEG